MSVALALPWLVPTHDELWWMFHTDVAMALAALMLAMWALVRPGRWQLTWPPLILMLVALVPLAQALGGMQTYRADALLASLYLAGSALAVAIGARAETIGPHRVPDALAAGFAIAAITSTGLLLYQWLRVDGLGVLVLMLPRGGRPIANLGQPNMLATLLVWGLLALWWGRGRGRIGGGVAVAAAAFLLFGTALTQSRAGALEVALVAVAAMFGSGGSRPGSRWVMLALLGWFMALVLVLPGLTNTLQLEPVQTLEQQVQPGRRLQIWAMALQQIAHRPFFGWGWTEGMGAQLALGDSGPLLHLLVTYAHNLLLDLLVWNGIPLGLTIFLAIAGWFVIRWRNHAPADRPMLLALTCLLIHALVELPHAYAFFLLPAGLMVGVIEAHVAKRPVLAAPRFLIVGLTVLLALVLAVVSVEYVRIEAALLETRMRIARVGTHAPPSPPQVWLLRPFVELLEVLVITPDITLDNAELDKVRRVAERFPSGPNLFRYAQSAALTGRPDEARRALALICQVTPPGHCQASSQAWRLLADTKYPAMATILPPSKCAAEIRLPPRQQSPDPAGADKFGRMPLNPLCDHDPSP